MIKRRSRLPREEFHAPDYRTIRTPYFSLRFKKDPRGETRIGIIVSNAVHKSAAKRNFWKRQARTAIVAQKLEGVDILMVLSPKTNTLTRKQFKETVERAAIGLRKK